MDPRLLKYYNRELQHIREMGGEFAAEYPKIAGRLGLEGFDCADPYVERLIEGFAFLAARVQLKLDAQYPVLTQHLLEMIYPHYLAPLPSMAIVRLQPDLTQSGLAQGYDVPRQTQLRGQLGKEMQTACEFRTAHAVKLYPLEVSEAEYLASTGAVVAAGISDATNVRAAIRMRLRAKANLPINKLLVDNLVFYLRGSGEFPMRVLEQLVANCERVVVRPTVRPTPWFEVIEKHKVRRKGYADDESLLPYTAPSFQGYRLLHEYFAFPERYLFVDLDGLGPAFKRCEGEEIEVLFLLNRSDRELQNALGREHFELFCTPAINLFPKRADRIHLNDRDAEFHVVPDRTRPMDFEVYQVTEVKGIGADSEFVQDFLPFYSIVDSPIHPDFRAYHTVHRVPRMLSSKQRLVGTRSSYIGSEVFVSLVDAQNAPYKSDLRQLALRTLCSNRDLPLALPTGVGDTDFTLPEGGPIKAVRCLAGPTRPRPSFAEGETSWRLISHLALNYLSLIDNDAEQGAGALREILSLYCPVADAAVSKQVEGVRAIDSRPIIRRLPGAGIASVARGLEITTTFEESAFEGTGMFVLGSVIEAFFAKYVSINAFTETVVKTVERGEIVRWPARMGLRQRI